jgi:4-hydroxythreonine-4-phosphate dehydrogenase
VRRAATAHRVAAVLAPAFPANGRTTVHGHQLLHGKHLHLTELGQREKMSSRCDLAAVMQAAGLTTSVVALSLIRSSQLDLSSALHELATRADVLICDAETDSDLHSIAASAITLGPSTIWAGSAGLAYHLPLAAGLSRPIQLTHLPPPPALPIMLAIGSTSVVTREQVSYLLASSPITAITIAPAALLDGPSSPTWQHAQANVTAALAAQEDTAILIGDETIVPKDVASRLALAMGQFLAPHHAGVGALVATGGETARAVMQAWGISALRLLAEVEPGLPLSVTEGWHRPLPVITKAGAFGQPSALVHCLRTLKKPSSLHPGTPL